MAVHPFGMWQVGDAFYQAVDLEDEEDDQYEEECDEKRNKFQLKFSGIEQVCADLLVVSIGTAANMFVETFVDLPPKAVGEIINPVDEETKGKKATKQISLLYEIDSTIVCQCKAYIPAEDTHNWVKTLIFHVQPKTVVVLTSQTKTSYHGDRLAKNSDADILRHMKTSTLTGGAVVPCLEHGTVISDLPAALVSYCEVMSLPAKLYVSFTESHFVDVFTLKTLEKVLGDDLLNKLPQFTKAHLNGRLKDFEGVGVADNNLYI